MSYANPGCGHKVSNKNKFCGKCGQAVLSQESEERTSQTKRPPAGQMGAYQAEISRKNPSCLIFLIDQSGSMARRIAGSDQQKKQAVADAINRLLYNTILRCTKESGVEPYFDVGIFGYGKDGGVMSAFEGDLLTITEIADQPKRVEMRKRRERDASGEIYEQEMHLPIWFDPVADGKTPMNSALERASAAVSGWVGTHQTSFPPVLINITDGGFTDKNPAGTVAEIQQQSTRDGNVLLFNCHLSEKEGNPVVFPGEASAGSFQKRMRELFDISSPLPEPFCKQARAKGYSLETGARGYAFNADIVTLIDFLDIGTRPVQDREEEEDL